MPDLRLVTAAAAAEHCRVTRGAIRMWVSRGYLSSVDQHDGVAYFLLSDVLRAERRTRQNGGSRWLTT